MNSGKKYQIFSKFVRISRNNVDSLFAKKVRVKIGVSGLIFFLFCPTFHFDEFSGKFKKKRKKIFLQGRNKITDMTLQRHPVGYTGDETRFPRVDLLLSMVTASGAFPLFFSSRRGRPRCSSANTRLSSARE